MVRYGALIVLYSVFEVELYNLCQSLSSFSLFCIKQKDIQSKKGYLGISKKYLQKVVALEIINGHEIWAEITKIQLIRNLVVHKNGILDDNRNDDNYKNIVAYAKSNDEFFVIDKISSSHLQIRITNDFLYNALTQFNKYFGRIQEALIQKYSNGCVP